MQIEIKNTSPKVIQALLESESPEGVTLQLVQPRLQCDTSIDWISLIVTLAPSVPIGLFVNWLSRYLFDNKISTKITINRKEIYFDDGQITRMLEETRTIEQDKVDD